MALTHRPARTILLLVLLAGLMPLAGAVAAAANQFEVTVPLTPDGEEAAFRTGMADLLVRITGRRDAAGLEALAPLVTDAPRYVSTYRRVAGHKLMVAYDEDAVESAVADAGLPFWGEPRPATLVWLAVDRGGGQRGLVMAETTGAEKAQVEAVAGQRGLPLAWPSSLAGEDARRRFEQVWSGDTAALAGAAPRYGAEGVLVGKAVAGRSGDYSVDWTFIAATGRSQVRGDLSAGVHLAADRYASLYASTAAVQRSELDITVSSVTSTSAFAEVSRELGSMASVRNLRLLRVLPDTAVFRASVRGGLEALQREAAAGGRLRPLAGEQGRALFTYGP